MPHYSYELEIPAGTAKTKEVELEMPCAWGILHDVVISFRSGTDRLAHVHVDDSLHQIFPTNANGDYAFDGYALLVSSRYVLLAGTRKIYLRGWNTGDYPHTVAVSFAVTDEEELLATEGALEKLVEIWEKITGIKAGES